MATMARAGRKNRGEGSHEHLLLVLMYERKHADIVLIPEQVDDGDYEEHEEQETLLN